MGTTLKLGLEPNVVTYSTVIRGYCLLGHVDDALSLHVKLITFGFKGFNHMTYGTLVDGLCKTQGPSSALSFLLKYNVSPDIVMCNTIIASQCKKGDYDDAFELYSYIIHRNVPLDTVTFNTIIDGFFAVREMKARKVFFSMISQKFVPDVFTFSILVNHLSKKKKFREAKACLAMMAKLDIAPAIHTFTALFQGCFLANQVTKGVQLFQNLPHLGICHDKVSFTLLMHGLFKSKMFDEALQLWNTLLSDTKDP